MTMTVRFWGVRGSIPSPGPETARTGGNTSCVEITAGDSRVILDAGTGLRRLGNSLLAQGGAIEAHVLLSHVHWDHIQGLPFFAPIYVPGTRLHVTAGANGTPLTDTMRRQMSTPNFPVDFRDVGSQVHCREVKDKERFAIQSFQITSARANHPDSVYAYRIEHEGRVIVYATDTEHYSCVDQRLVSLARDADLLIYDAQYLPEEYAGNKGMSRVGWGHSTYEAGAQLARAAGVKELVLFHHDPSRTDDGVEEIEARSRELFSSVHAAREGMMIEVSRTSSSQIVAA